VEEISYIHYQDLSNFIVAHLSKLTQNHFKSEGKIRILFIRGSAHIIPFMDSNSINIEFVTPNKQIPYFKEDGIYCFLDIQNLKAKKKPS
jgi:hypothetical protein